MSDMHVTHDLSKMVREAPPASNRPERYHIRERLNELRKDPNTWYRIHVGKGAANLVYGHLRKVAGDDWKSYYEVRTAAKLPDGTVLPEGQKAVWARYTHVGATDNGQTGQV